MLIFVGIYSNEAYLIADILRSPVPSRRPRFAVLIDSPARLHGADVRSKLVSCYEGPSIHSRADIAPCSLSHCHALQALGGPILVLCTKLGISVYRNPTQRWFLHGHHLAKTPCGQTHG